MCFVIQCIASSQSICQSSPSEFDAGLLEERECLIDCVRVKVKIERAVGVET